MGEISSTIIILMLILVIVISERFHIGTTPQGPQPQPPVTPEEEQRYMAYLKTMIACVQNSRAPGLDRPGDVPRHLPTNGRRPFLNRNGKNFYVMEFDRERHFTGGIGRYVYNTTPVNTIIGKLNATLPNYCIANGIAPAQIVHGADMGNGRIAFAVEVMA